MKLPAHNDWPSSFNLKLFYKVWEATVSSSSAAGIRIADVDGDGFMEAVVATFDGYVICFHFSLLSVYYHLISHYILN